MTKIESHSAQTELGEYMFLVDIDGNINDKTISTMLDIIKNKCSYFRILGLYVE